MKNLVIIVIAAITIASVTSCTKSKHQPTHYDIITSHTWYLKYLMRADTEANSSCNLSETLVFKKDSTGAHSYGSLCYATQPGSIAFRWYLEDNTTVGQYYTGTIQTSMLYNTDIAGISDSNTIFRLYVITQDSLAMEGVANSGTSWRLIYTSTP